MSLPLISVIVPVYKAEEYLDKCVQSIRNQTYENLEIILVDDGSPDRCGEMCDAYAQEDARIRVFHKENGGQSSARNLGLDNMAGEYVGFVDSDDWIEPEMYACLYGLVAEHKAKIAGCGIQCDHADGRAVLYNARYPAESRIDLFSTEEALKELTLSEKITNSPCDKLFHKSVFSDIRMSVGKVFEDFEMMPHCLEKTEVFAYDPRPLYHYFMTEQSTTRGKFHRHRFLEAQISVERMAYFKQKYPQLYVYALASHVEICMNIVSASAESEFVQERKALIRQLKKAENWPAFPLLSTKRKIKYLLFMLNTNLFSKLMNARYGR